MLQFQDFVPKMTSAPGFLKSAEYESFEEAVAAANRWLYEHPVRIIHVETDDLPNIWSRYEEGSTDTELGTSGESPSHWHQFVRIWYDSDHPA
ncbi:MAG: hypothetical protein JJ992_24545 [Planctomycetes bacterium]|nr:hypothetical protein [Planctomycetota bacterium]